MYKQFDIVRIKTTKRVHWMSGPPGESIDPQGNWSVVGALGVMLVLCKDQTIIVIPFEDVTKVADYRIEKLFEESSNGQKGEGKSKQS